MRRGGRGSVTKSRVGGRMPYRLLLVPEAGKKFGLVRPDYWYRLTWSSDEFDLDFVCLSKYV